MNLRFSPSTMTTTSRKRKLEETEEDSAEEGLQRKRTKSFNDNQRSAPLIDGHKKPESELETAISDSDEQPVSDKIEEKETGIEDEKKVDENEIHESTNELETIKSNDATEDKPEDHLSTEGRPDENSESKDIEKNPDSSEKQVLYSGKQPVNSEIKEEKDEEKKTDEKSENEAKDSTSLNEGNKQDNEQKSSGATKIFGSTTPFGSQSWKPATAVVDFFADDSKTSDKSETKIPANCKVFGTGSIFGSSFKPTSLDGAQKNVFDSLPDKKVEKQDQKIDSLVGEAKEHNPDFKQQEIETGEELEESVYSCRSKLYALDPTAEKMAWKERGVGSLHINNNKSENKSRIVMRSDGSLRVILNMPLTKDLDMNMGMKSSFASDKIVRLTSMEGDKPIQYAFKVASASIATELYAAIEKLVS